MSLVATAACVELPKEGEEVDAEPRPPSLLSVSVDVLNAGTRLDPEVAWTPLATAEGVPHTLAETAVALRLTATWSEPTRCDNRPLQNATLTLGPGLRVRPGQLESEDAARKNLSQWIESFGQGTENLETAKKALASVRPSIAWSGDQCILSLPLLVTGAAGVARGEVKLSIEGVGNATVVYAIPAISPRIVRVFSQQETKATGTLLPLEESGTSALTFACSETSTGDLREFTGSYAGGSLAVCVNPVNRHRLTKPIAVEAAGAVVTPQPDFDCSDVLVDVTGEDADNLVWLVRPKAAGELAVKAIFETGSAVATAPVKPAVALLETVERKELEAPVDDKPGRYRERLTFCTSFDGFVPVSLAGATDPLELLEPTAACSEQHYPSTLRVVRISDGVPGAWQFASTEGTRTGVVWDVLEGATCE